MREHGGSGGVRLVAVLSAIVIASGITIAGMGVATASMRPSQFVIISFVPSLDEVTLQIPTPPCKHESRGCVWKLSVNEPLAPGTPVLGQATGRSGLLVVKYPAAVCGTVQGDASVALQADVSVGGSVWHYKVGHRITIPCPSTSPGAAPADPAATGTAPFTGAPSTADQSGHAVQTAAVAQLPFTGVGVRSLALTGTSFVLAGLVLAAGLEQRRRLVRRVRVMASWLFGL